MLVLPIEVVTILKRMKNIREKRVAAGLNPEDGSSPKRTRKQNLMQRKRIEN